MEAQDNLGQELNILIRFEMEAAGSMDYFPCLVEECVTMHKNKQWQGYALLQQQRMQKSCSL